MTPYQESTIEPATNQSQESAINLKRNRGHGLVRCMTFIDGSWLYHNQDMLVKAYGAPYKIDFSKINVVALKLIRNHIANTLGGEAPMLDLLRTYYYASVPSNVHPDDAVKLEDQRKFYTMLAESLGFELMLHEIDFRGHYMAMQDRLAKESELNFMPKERTVDMALGVGMLYLAAIDAYDIAIAVLGDADYQPALERVRQLGKRILIFTIEGSAAYDYLYPKPDLRFADFPVVRFQDHLRELRLTPKMDRDRIVYQYNCARCGKEFYSTYKAPPRQNMYCDEHRIWRERESYYSTQANDQFAPGDNGVYETKPTTTGTEATTFNEQPLQNVANSYMTNTGVAEAAKPANGQPCEGNADAQPPLPTEQTNADNSAQTS